MSYLVLNNESATKNLYLTNTCNFPRIAININGGTSYVPLNTTTKNVNITYTIENTTDTIYETMEYRRSIASGVMTSIGSFTVNYFDTFTGLTTGSTHRYSSTKYLPDPGTRPFNDGYFYYYNNTSFNMGAGFYTEYVYATSATVSTTYSSYTHSYTNNVAEYTTTQTMLYAPQPITVTSSISTVYTTIYDTLYIYSKTVHYSLDGPGDYMIVSTTMFTNVTSTINTIYKTKQVTKSDAFINVVTWQ